LRALPVFAVGRRSAEATAAAGFTDVTSADGDVSDLARLVAARLQPTAPLLYLAGEDRSGDLAGELRARGFAVETTMIYRAIAATGLPPAAAEALASGIDGVLHFSRRSAEAYVNAARTAGMVANALKPVHFCLSAQVAEPLAQAGAADIRVAEHPNEAILIALIAAA
jgi:uroporphyrinogen-III synthase